MMKLVLVRHGESEWNKLNLFTGWTDVELSDTGVQEAKNAGKILKDEGFIIDFSVEGDVKKTMEITLKYTEEGQKVISGLRRISKPGLRVYAPADELPRVLNGLGIAIISTSNGMMTDRDARKQHVGGEVVAYVW